jgi:competence protein ComEC
MGSFTRYFVFLFISIILFFLYIYFIEPSFRMNMIDVLQRTPFIRILLPFLAGIIMEFYVRFPFNRLLIFYLLALFTSLVVILRRAGYLRDILTGILFTIFFFSAGIFVMSENSKAQSYPEGTYYQATILEKPEEKTKSYKAEAFVTSLLSKDTILSANEKIIVYFAKSDKIDSLKPGSSIVFNQTPREIENQGNPFEFDYKRYAALKDIRRQVYLKENSWITAGQRREWSISIQAERVRDFLLDIYRRNGLQGIEFEILSALTLGYKKSMDPEIKQVFAATGASHVLAVSGLHVGIVYLVFNLVFGFMRKNKHTRVLFVILAVSFLWAFAFITGLSPSVQRSALMFTIVLIGENLRRPTNIYNTLAASFFILTAINPKIIFDVGFQLSYAAVFGIVYFQPRLFSLFTFDSKPLNYLWGLFTVSLAAQITTFPLSCYYFNQFPVYFWLSNFLVIPMAFVFIFLGILILVTSPVAIISGFLAKIAILLVKFLYITLHWIEKFPAALLKGFNFPFGILVITVTLIVFLMLFIETKRLFCFRLLIFLVIVGLFYSAGLKVLQNQQKEIIAYKAEEPVLHLIYGRTNYILASESLLKKDFPEWQVNPVIRHLRLKDPVVIPFEGDYSDKALVKRGNYLFFDGTLLWFQNDETLPDETFFPDVILTKQAVLKMENLPRETMIISYAKNFPATSKKQNIHRVNEMGAWRSQTDLLH